MESLKEIELTSIRRLCQRPQLQGFNSDLLERR